MDVRGVIHSSNLWPSPSSLCKKRADHHQRHAKRTNPSRRISISSHTPSPIPPRVPPLAPRRTGLPPMHVQTRALRKILVARLAIVIFQPLLPRRLSRTHIPRGTPMHRQGFLPQELAPAIITTKRLFGRSEPIRMCLPQMRGEPGAGEDFVAVLACATLRRARVPLVSLEGGVVGVGFAAGVAVLLASRRRRRRSRVAGLPRPQLQLELRLWRRRHLRCW